MHNLFINNNSYESKHDLRWAYSMDIAISLAILALEYGLDEGDIKILQEEYMDLLPKKNEKEALSLEVYDYYKSHIIKANSSFNARDICDYILSLAHRRYAFKYNELKWKNSKFETVPIGLPRSKNRTKNARNYTSHQISAYKHYTKKLKYGKLYENVSIFTFDGSSWIKRDSNETIELTETTKEHWLHTRITNIQRIWQHINLLLDATIKLKSTENNSYKLNYILGLTAQIHWWITHAMPYRRGSAAVGDMLSKVILSYHNINTPYWKIGIAPDLEAFCTSLDIYIKNYCSSSFVKDKFKFK